MNARPFLQFALGIAVLTTVYSCTRLTVFKSRPESEVTSESIFSGYDATNKLGWLISNDKNYFYLRLETENRPTIMKILGGGLNLYLDTTSKKNQNISLQFPLSANARSRPELQDMPTDGIPDMSGMHSKMIQEISKEAIFNYGDNAERFNPQLDASPIHALLKEENGKLQYVAAIPFTNICPTGKQGLTSLSVGLVTGTFEMPSQGEGRPGMSGGPSGGGGMGGPPSGGGMGGGMGGPPTGGMGGGTGGPPAGGPGGGGGMGDLNSTANEPLKIWFGVELTN